MKKPLALLGLVVFVLSVLALPLALKAQSPLLEVVGYACDRNSGVTQLQVRLSGPGEVTLRWDNVTLCGRSI